MSCVQGRQQYGTHARPFNAYHPGLIATRWPRTLRAARDRSTRSGSRAGCPSSIENHLFYLDSTRMAYGDAQKVASQLIQAVKAVG